MKLKLIEISIKIMIYLIFKNIVAIQIKNISYVSFINYKIEINFKIFNNHYLNYKKKELKKQLKKIKKSILKLILQLKKFLDCSEKH